MYVNYYLRNTKKTCIFQFFIFIILNIFWKLPWLDHSQWVELSRWRWGCPVWWVSPCPQHWTSSYQDSGGPWQWRAEIQTIQLVLHSHQLGPCLLLVAWMNHSIQKLLVSLEQRFLGIYEKNLRSTCVFSVPPVLVEVNLDAERRTPVSWPPGTLKQTLTSFIPAIVASPRVGPALLNIEWLQTVAGVQSVPDIR